MRGARIGAAMLGISAEEYRARRERGERWCCGCKAWHPWIDFGRNRANPGGLSSYCRRSDAARQRRRHEARRAQAPRVLGGEAGA